MAAHRNFNGNKDEALGDKLESFRRELYSTPERHRSRLEQTGERYPLFSARVIQHLKDVSTL